MNLPILQRNTSCTACELHTLGCHSICIPTDLRRPSATPTDQAVLVVGEGPGHNEDLQDRNFVGASGQKLDDFYIYAPYLNQCADVYLGNSVRCRPPQNVTPSIGQVRACRPYLLDDIARLSAHYRRVAILCVGSTGLTSLLDKSTPVADMSGRQGLALGGWSNVYLFSTYHPAYLLRDSSLLRDPSHERKVKSVLLALGEWLLTGQIKQEEPPEVELAPPAPSSFKHGLLAIDLETNGCLVNGKQDHFHPVKIESLDRVPRDEIITTAQVCWRDDDDEGKIRTGVFRWDHPDERSEFLRWLRVPRTELWCQNAQYDVGVLRYCCGKGVIPFWSRLRDLLVETFLYDDGQERGLKTTAWLYRITDYADDPAPARAYTDSSDKRLWVYGCKDPWATYRGLEVCAGWMADRFARHDIAKDKLTPERYTFYSDQIWSAIGISEYGCAMDTQELTAVDADIRQKWDTVVAECASLGVIVRGTGSDASVQQLVFDAVRLCEELLPTDDFESLRKNLELTDVSQMFSTGADNRNQLLGALPDTTEESRLTAQKLSLVNEASSLEKIITSYTGPMLRGRKPKVVRRSSIQWTGKPGRPRKDGKGLTKSTLVPKLKPDKRKQITIYEKPAQLITRRTQDGRLVGMAYPTIYILPKATDESGGKGGVRQPRWSFKEPALQTLPEVIFNCTTSRYFPGIIWALDLAQVEWRMAAFLSGDEVMLREIADGTDIHTRTAYKLLGFDRAELPEWMSSTYARRILCAAPDLMLRQNARLWADGGYKDTFTVGMDTWESFVHAWLRQNIGKSQNFAELYGGMPSVIQRTCRIKGGINIPMTRVQHWYDWTQGLYSGRTRWRESLVQSVVDELVLHLPIYGQSRTFGGTERDIRGLLRPQILDMPVQGPAFNLMISGMIDAQKEWMSKGLKTRFISQIHDASPADSPIDEYETASDIFQSALQGSYYLKELERLHGRKFPLAWEVSEVKKIN